MMGAATYKINRRKSLGLEKPEAGEWGSGGEWGQGLKKKLNSEENCLLSWSN